MNFLIVVVGLILLSLLIFWDNFRNWVSNALDSLWTIIEDAMPTVAAFLRDAVEAILRVVSIYTLAVSIASVGLVIWMSIALLINAPVLTAIVFIFSISLILIMALPAGVLLRIFGVTKTVIPQFLRTTVALIAFVGFVGLLFPELISFKAVLGITLLAFITLGVTAKINLLDKIIFPLAIVMSMIVVWKHFFPEDFRSTVRYAQSWSKSINTGKDRGSLRNETNAATTYAAVIRDVQVLYLRNGDELDVVAKSLAKGLKVRLVDHKDEIFIYDGQGLVQIQLAKENGSYIGGSKYWIEAEYVDIITPKEMVSQNREAEDGVIYDEARSGVRLLERGKTYAYDLKSGDQTPWLGVYDKKKFSYAVTSKEDDFKLFFSDGTSEVAKDGLIITPKQGEFLKVAVDSEQVVFVTMI